MTHSNRMTELVLGRNSRHFAELEAHRARRRRRDTRLRAVILALAAVGAFALADAIYGAMHAHNAARMVAPHA